MGAIAEGMVAFAQPLIDQTDGSHEQVNKALTLSSICFNLALLPEESREKTLDEMQPDLMMNDEEFEAFRRDVVVPMIKRHEQMFPMMHRRFSSGEAQDASPWERFRRESKPAEKFVPLAEPYAPCPCDSGKKYKFCCGSKRR